MFKTWKRIAMTISAVSVMACMLFPLAAYASGVNTSAAVVGFSALSTAISAGQSATFSITTNAAATHVFATVDGANVSGQLQSADAAGNKTWNFSVMPRATQNVPIYVNTTNSTTGAVVFNVQVTVAASGGGGGFGGNVNTGGSAGTSGVTIGNITESRGSSTGTVALTIETNPRASDVWVQFNGNQFAKARLNNETAAAKVWTMTIKPSAAQSVTVSANTGYFTAGAATKPFSVTMTAAGTASTGKPSISSVRANRSDLVTGDSVTLTVTTNIHAQYVWVEFDNEDIEADMTRESRTTKTWTAKFTPDRSQTLTVFANSEDSESGAVTRTHRVTVSDRRYENARIISASASNNGYGGNGFYDSGYATITVETNSSTNYVWLEANGSRVGNYNSSNYSTLSNGNRRWTLSVYYSDLNHYINNGNYQTVTVCAGENSSTRNDSRSVNVDWWGGNYGYDASVQFNSTSYRVGDQITARVYAYNFNNIYNYNNFYVTVTGPSGNNISSGYINIGNDGYVYLGAPNVPGTYTIYLYAYNNNWGNNGGYITQHSTTVNP